MKSWVGVYFTSVCLLKGTAALALVVAALVLVVATLALIHIFSILTPVHLYCEKLSSIYLLIRLCSIASTLVDADLSDADLDLSDAEADADCDAGEPLDLSILKE